MKWHIKQILLAVVIIAMLSMLHRLRTTCCHGNLREAENA